MLKVSSVSWAYEADHEYCLKELVSGNLEKELKRYKPRTKHLKT